MTRKHQHKEQQTMSTYYVNRGEGFGEGRWDRIETTDIAGVLAEARSGALCWASASEQPRETPEGIWEGLDVETGGPCPIPAYLIIDQ